MTAHGQTITMFDSMADQILREMGVDPEGPIAQFSDAAGIEFGQRFVEFLSADQNAVDGIAREWLAAFSSIFPVKPNTETIELQAFILGPFVSSFLAGRGLTIPEMAVLANVSIQRAYRLNRKALTIIYTEKEPPVRNGVNRRFSGRDGRETHHVVDPGGLGERPWPAPADSIQPFMLGVMRGLQNRLEGPQVRRKLEPRFRRALSNLLQDPSLGDLMDGVVLALVRIAQGLRDTAPGQSGPILQMKAEREKSLAFQAMLVELSRQRPAILAELAKVGQSLRSKGPKGLISLPA